MADCDFPNRFEPFYCRVHHAVRMTLDKARCNRGDPQRDDDAIEGLVDAAIRRGEITASRGAEILGLPLHEWRQRAQRFRLAATPPGPDSESREEQIKRIATAIVASHMDSKEIAAYWAPHLYDAGLRAEGEPS